MLSLNQQAPRFTALPPNRTVGTTMYLFPAATTDRSVAVVGSHCRVAISRGKTATVLMCPADAILL
jgi:hypothetical protein